MSGGSPDPAPCHPHARKLPPKLVLLCLFCSRQGTTLEPAWQPTPAWDRDPEPSPFRPPEPEAMRFVAAAVLGRLAAPRGGAWACGEVGCRARQRQGGLRIAAAGGREENVRGVRGSRSAARPHLGIFQREMSPPLPTTSGLSLPREGPGQAAQCAGDTWLGRSVLALP